jgi:Fe-S cluster assembly ATP-binding protein
MSQASMVPVLEITDLHVSVGEKEILRGVSLTVGEGEKVAIMGPNGSGKTTLSNVLLGKPGYRIDQGSIRFMGQDLSSLSTHERAQLGLCLVSQYPQEVEGVDLKDLVGAALSARGLDLDGVESRVANEARKIGFSESLLGRWVNVDLSGGEKKRLETLLLSLVPARLAVLDELDSGLDIDALRQVSQRIEDLSSSNSMAVVAITHYSRLLKTLTVSRVLVLAHGLFVTEGGPELAEELETTGYRDYTGKGTPTEDIFPF